jgi:hypothetical protein
MKKLVKEAYFLARHHHDKREKPGSCDGAIMNLSTIYGLWKNLQIMGMFGYNAPYHGCGNKVKWKGAFQVG